MTDLRTAAQQALEALEENGRLSAIAILRAALEQPEQEQAWLTGCPSCGMDGGCDCEALEQSEQEPVAWRLPDPDPEGRFEWVLYQAADFMPGVNPMEHFDGLEPLYTHPPRREWRGLTEEEIRRMGNETPGQQGGWNLAFARAIEAALKERNA